VISFKSIGISVLATLILFASGTAHSPASAQSATSLGERHTVAARLFREGQYAGAYGRFVELADAGHVPSAQLALVMYTHGGELFGSQWSATLAQRRRWHALVINAARQQVDLPDAGSHSD
jgi:hypothetical protein